MSVMGAFTEAAARGPVAELERRELDAELRALLRALPFRQLAVLLGRFGFGGEELTYRRSARALGISDARVRQIEARALNYLRHPARARRLR